LLLFNVYHTLPSHAGYGISRTDRALLKYEEISLFENYAGLWVRVNSDLYTVLVHTYPSFVANVNSNENSGQITDFCKTRQNNNSTSVVKKYFLYFLIANICTPRLRSDDVVHDIFGDMADVLFGSCCVSTVRSYPRSTAVWKTAIVSCTVLWIRTRIRIPIRMDPYHFGNLNPDPHPHQIKTGPRSASKVISWIRYGDPNPHQFTDDKPKRMDYEPIWALFQGFEPLFGR
jgi:hypothetical protein